MDVMLLTWGTHGNWVVPRAQFGRVRAKLGRKTKVCLPVTLEKTMCATKRCTSLGCTGLVTRSLSLLEGLEACKGGIELSHGPGHAVPGMQEACQLGEATQRPAGTAWNAFSHHGRAVTAKGEGCGERKQK